MDFVCNLCALALNLGGSWIYPTGSQVPQQEGDGQPSIHRAPICGSDVDGSEGGDWVDTV